MENLPAGWELIDYYDDYDYWDELIDGPLKVKVHAKRSIVLPSPARTYKAKTFARFPPEQKQIAYDEFCRKMLNAFQNLVDSDSRLLVLDWKHQGYYLYPHRANPDNISSWPVIPVPNGDFTLFLASDYSFGHVQECCGGDMYIFGESLLEQVDNEQPQLLGEYISNQRGGANSGFSLIKFLFGK